MTDKDPHIIEVNFRHILGVGSKFGDCILDDIELDFPIRLALFNAGLGHGWRIKYTKQPKRKNDTLVTSPWIIELKGENAISVGYDADRPNRAEYTMETVDIKFTVKTYTLRDIYWGALKALEKWKK